MIAASTMAGANIVSIAISPSFMRMGVDRVQSQSLSLATHATS